MNIFRPTFTTSTFSSKKKKKNKSADHKPIKIKGLNSNLEDFSGDSDNDEIRGAEDVSKAPGTNEIIKENYNFESFDYVQKFCAFRCNKDGKHVEWIDINTLALLNGKRKFFEIKMKHQPLGKRRKIINLPWE